jgi:hypothetical protein
MPSRCRLALTSAALLLALTPIPSRAQDGSADLPMRVPKSPGMPARAHRLRSAAAGDTIYVGYTPGRFSATANWWSIGAGRGAGFHRPPAQGGMWDWEPTMGSYLHGDSLQGWWPRRLAYGSTGGQALTDRNRPWWALDFGNQVNYVLQSGGDGRRTFGVVGVWHRDDAGPPDDGAPGIGQPTWAPIAGSYSAWMGLRRHGDTRFTDPITNNPFNEDCAQFNVHGSTGATGTDKGFPGYAGQMDQMLFRDIDLSSAPGADLTIGFSCRLRLSTGFVTASGTRTGWFDKDPLAPTTGIANPQPDNFISSSDAGTLAPRDSFMVYIGAPADRGDFADAVPDSFLASTGQRLPIYDRQRRWFAEVLRANEGLYRELESMAGDVGPLARSVTIPNAVLAPMLAASGNRLRIVFRVKTNRGFDDEGTAYSSNGGGAAVVDAVTWSAGALASAAGWGEFEDEAAIDNSLTTTPQAAWKSTGKPPSHWFHPHALADLLYEDLCGQPGDVSRICNLSGVVISMGDHDHGEAAGGQYAGTAEFERWDGIASPAIQLGGPYPNPIGLQDVADATPTDDYYIALEIYAGVFDVFTQGNLWWPGFQSYPASAKPGSGGYATWGNIQYVPFTVWSPEKKCFRETYAVRGNGLLKTSNASGVPDSVRLVFLKRQECFRFGVSMYCPSSDGAYLDHFSLAIVDGAAEPISLLNAWDLFQDAFPATEDATLPAFAAKFDTTAALVKTGANIAPLTTPRFDVPGDSAVVFAAPAERVRMDLVFRILPGPGNYTVIGRPDLGTLRRVPSDAAPIVTGDLTNFWSSYLADNGSYGTPGGHGAAWNPNVWNSARCDTAERNLFELQSRGILANPYGPGLWQTTYHESELGLPHAADGYPSTGARAGLGIPRHKCFVATATAASGDVDCVHDPPATGPGYDLTYVATPGSGYDGQPWTVEGTKILPDGMFTPGTHVEYFFRREDDGVASGLMPDTNVVYPQPGEFSLDGHRWQQFGILPDRWKSPDYRHPVTGAYGPGEACAIVVDANDRFGNERVWVGVADTLNATSQARHGAHNGWSARGDQDVNDPAGFVRAHLGQAGTTWDLYQVRAAENARDNAGSVGNRLAHRDPANPQIDGKASRQGPSVAMMNAFYRSMIYLTGGFTSGLLGPLQYHSQDDVRLIREWLAAGDPAEPDRGFWGIGNGLIESCWYDGPTQTTFAREYLGAGLLAESYLLFSGNTESTPDLYTPAGSPIEFPTDVWGVRNVCLWTNDVLEPSAELAAEVSGVAAYENYDPGPYPMLASVSKEHTPNRPWQTLIDGFDLANLTSRFDTNSQGRLRYLYKASWLGVPCTLFPSIIWPGVDDSPAGTDFASFGGNPARSGTVGIRFGLAADDRVEAKVFDVSGRLVRLLADRRFAAGEHVLRWDGNDDAGARVPGGVYFTRIRFLARGFSETKKLTLLPR